MRVNKLWLASRCSQMAPDTRGPVPPPRQRPQDRAPHPPAPLPQAGAGRPCAPADPVASLLELQPPSAAGHPSPTTRWSPTHSLAPPPGTDASVDRGPGPLGRNSLWWGRCDALDVPRAEGSFWPVRGARRVFMERTDGISRLSIISLHFFILGPILKLPIPLKRQGGNFSLMSFC